MKKKISEQLFDRLTKMGLEPAELPKRLMTGYWQRSAGAWRWYCKNKDGLDIGSQETMLQCVKAKTLTTHRQGLDTHVNAED
jgi:hypothetical protein